MHRPFRGLLSVHSGYGPHTRAVTVSCDSHSEGCSRFFTAQRLRLRPAGAIAGRQSHPVESDAYARRTTVAYSGISRIGRCPLRTSGADAPRYALNIIVTKVSGRHVASPGSRIDGGSVFAQYKRIAIEKRAVWRRKPVVSRRSCRRVLPEINPQRAVGLFLMSPSIGSRLTVG